MKILLDAEQSPPCFVKVAPVPDTFREQILGFISVSGVKSLDSFGNYAHAIRIQYSFLLKSREQIFKRTARELFWGK